MSHMTLNLEHILVFKTNINTHEEKIRVQDILQSHEHVDEANIDIEDIDKVLRVVSCNLSPDHIIKLITQSGYECRELE
jgi:hypothetical protein